MPLNFYVFCYDTAAATNLAVIYVTFDKIAFNETSLCELSRFIVSYVSPLPAPELVPLY